MTDEKPKRWWHVLKAPVFSPQGFRVRAVLIVIVYVIGHLAGWRDYVSIITSTTSPAELNQKVVESSLAAAYVVLYLGFVLVAPILAIASGILALLLRKASPPPTT